MNELVKVWNLKDLLPTHKGKEFDKIISDLKGKVEFFEKRRPSLKVDIPISDFNELIKDLEQIKEILSKLVAYGYLWFTENTNSQEARAYRSKIENLTTETENKLLFFSIWWKKLDESNAQRLMNGSGENKYSLEHERKLKDHLLEEDSEKVINLKSVTGIDAIIKLYDMIRSSFRFILKTDDEERELTESELKVYVRDPDPKIRQRAYESLLDVCEKHKEILGEIYFTIVRDWDNEHLTLRKYTLPIEVRNKANDIPNKVVDLMLQACRENLHLFDKYFKLKARALGIDKFSRFDLYAPIGKESKIKYEHAVKLVLDTFNSYSPQIGELAQKVFDEQHIHSKLGKHKQSGAYCYSITPRITPYVLLNYTETMKDAETLAHELGHAVHSMLASHRTIFTFHAVLPLAETSSIFGEMMVTQRLFEKENDPEIRKQLIASKLDDLYGSIIRQAFFVLFEREAHSMIKEGATVTEVAQTYYSNLKEQFKDSDVSEKFSLEWLHIPHIFHTPFYCYAYSFGNLLTLSLYKMYQEQGKEFIPKYIRLLSAGKSASPHQIVSEVGMDITKKEFWEKGFGVIKEMVDEFEKLCEG